MAEAWYLVPMIEEECREKSPAIPRFRRCAMNDFLKQTDRNVPFDFKENNKNQAIVKVNTTAENIDMLDNASVIVDGEEIKFIRLPDNFPSDQAERAKHDGTRRKPSINPSGKIVFDGPLQTKDKSIEEIDVVIRSSK